MKTFVCNGVRITPKMRSSLLEELLFREPDYPLPEFITTKQIAQAVFVNGGYFAGIRYSYRLIVDKETKKFVGWLALPRTFGS